MYKIKQFGSIYLYIWQLKTINKQTYKLQTINKQTYKHIDT